MPFVGTTGIFIRQVVRAVMDGQLQRVHASTTVFICIGVGINAALGIGGVVPNVRFTNRVGYHIVCTVIDSEVKGICTRTAIFVGVGVCIDTAFIVGDIMPSISLARRIGYYIVRTLMDGQVQEDDTVATRLIGQE